LGVRQDTTEKGTAVRKAHLNDKIGTPDVLGLTVPEQVNVVMAEVAGDLCGGLLALAVGTDLQVMTALMEADVSSLAGSPGQAQPRAADGAARTRAGSVTLGGRRVPVQRPRVRAADGSGELPVPALRAVHQPAPSCSAGWRWRRCSPGCRRAATVRLRWSRSVRRSPACELRPPLLGRHVGQPLRLLLVQGAQARP
jgi:hypothetical protein